MKLDERIPVVVQQWITQMTNEKEPPHVRENYCNSLESVARIMLQYSESFRKAQDRKYTKR